MKKKRRKLNKKNLVLLILFCLSGILVIVSGIFVVRWALDNKDIAKLENKILEKTNIEEREDNDKTEIIPQAEEEPQTSPYWEYIKMNLINVDFTELKNTNPDVKGWIQVAGTNINYPFVQTADNDYYLTHAFDKTYNSAGWVFLDYRNNINNLGKNTILYAHGRYDKTMFGSLKNIFNTNWYNDINNHIIKLSTETENTLWQVFSVYITPTINDYIQTDFLISGQFGEFVNMLQGRSQLSFNTTVSENDKILTLSTCYNDEEKVVLHAKLIKREART